MRELAAVLGVVAVLGGAALWWGARRPPPPRFARFEREHGLPVLRLAGPPEAKGEAHGRLLAGAIARRLEALVPEDEGMRGLVLQTYCPQMAPHVSSAQRAEMEGIAAGSGRTFEEILFLNARLDMAPFLGGAPEGADAAAAADGSVVRVFGAGEAAPDPADLMIVVHEDADPPLVLVALPGMVGGFLGVRGKDGAAFAPSGDGDPVLRGRAWTLLLRDLLAAPPRPGDELPGPPTVRGSMVLAVDGDASVLAVTPAGAARFSIGDGFVSAAVPSFPAGTRVQTGAWDGGARRLNEERGRRLLTARPDGRLAVHVRGRQRGVRVRITGPGGSRSATVRFEGR